MDSTLYLILEKFSKVFISFFTKETFYAAIIFAFILILTTCLKKISPRWQLGLWALIIIRLVLPVDLSHSLSGRNLLGQIPICKSAYEAISGLFSKTSEHDTEILNGMSIGNILDSEIIDRTNSIKINKRIPLWQIVVFMIWLIGFLTLLAVYLSRLSKIRRIIKHASRVEIPEINGIFTEWKTQFQIKRKVKLVTSERFLSPFTIGILRPVIFIPESLLSSNNTGMLQSIIAHEMAHIKRFDDLWTKFQNIIQLIYFFNPVVWFVNSKIFLCRECICDSMVLSERKISLQAYGQGMMAVLKLNIFGSDTMSMQPCFGSHQDKFKYRIKKLKGDHNMKKYQSFLIYGSLFILGLFILPMAGNIIQSNDAAQSFQLIAAEQGPKINISAPQPLIDDVFNCPIKVGRVTAPFGKMINPFTKKEALHKGIDIAARKGTEVYAAADGVVKVAFSKILKKSKCRGKYIIINHNDGFSTMYSHLSEVLITKGQKVKAGDLIARIGNTGKSTGPHLHFEIRKNKKAQDPEKHIDFSTFKRHK